MNCTRAINELLGGIKWVNYRPMQKNMAEWRTPQMVDGILPEDHFLRLHRSLIINANYVDCIESKAIAIGNHVFTIPKAHRHLITEYFLLFQRKKE